MFLGLLGRIRPPKVGLRENFGLAEHTLGTSNGCAASSRRSGMGSDSTRWRTGTWP